MLALPAEAFEPRRVAQGHANSLSLVRFDRNDYSVPTAYAHHEVTVIGGIEEVAITSGTDVIARHRRHWGKEHTTFDPIHYLALLERKPGAIDFARPLENWGLPGCFSTLAPAPRSRPRSARHPRVHQGAAALGERHAARAHQSGGVRPSPSEQRGPTPSP